MNIPNPIHFLQHGLNDGKESNWVIIKKYPSGHHGVAALPQPRFDDRIDSTRSHRGNKDPLGRHYRRDNDGIHNRPDGIGWDEERVVWLLRHSREATNREEGCRQQGALATRVFEYHRR